MQGHLPPRPANMRYCDWQIRVFFCCEDEDETKDLEREPLDEVWRRDVVFGVGILSSS